jgi:hypothetical protein
MRRGLTWSQRRRHQSIAPLLRVHRANHHCAGQNSHPRQTPQEMPAGGIGLDTRH